MNLCAYITGVNMDRATIGNTGTTLPLLSAFYVCSIIKCTLCDSFPSIHLFFITFLFWYSLCSNRKILKSSVPFTIMPLWEKKTRKIKHFTNQLRSIANVFNSPIISFNINWNCLNGKIETTVIFHSLDSK